MSSDAVAALGAFLSGAGSVLGAWIAIRAVRKRMREECEERFAIFKEGIKTGEQHDRLDP